MYGFSTTCSFAYTCAIVNTGLALSDEHGNDGEGDTVKVGAAIVEKCRTIISRTTTGTTFFESVISTELIFHIKSGTDIAGRSSKVTSEATLIVGRDGDILPSLFSLNVRIGILAGVEEA